MKTLRESLLDDDLVDKTDEYIKDEIEKFLKANYNGTIKISQKPNADGKYEVSSNSVVEVINKNITSLTNGIFIWTTVDGSFSVIDCISLKSLEGAPEKVGRTFNCSECTSLKSLEGTPENVEGCFYCDGCNSLKSLEGAPKKVRGDFYCINCRSLKTLDGSSQTVNRSFYCNNCSSLTSLNGAPKKVDGDFNCYGCAGKFTIEDVKKISNVKKDIIC